MASETSARLTIRYPSALRVDENIELRLVGERDASRIFELTDRNRQYLRKWLPWVDGTQTAADTMAFIERAMEQVRQGQGFHACIEYRGDLAGVIGHVYLDPVNRRTEIGYWLGEEFQGRGIMTRACRRLVDQAFESLGLNRVVIRVAVENRKSRAIPERLGFVQEGVLREVVWQNDAFADLVMYAILRREWKPADPKAPRSL